MSNADYYQKHKERLKKASRQYQEENREVILARKRAYYAAHKEERCAYERQWRLENPAEKKARAHAYYIQNREKVILRVAIYRKENREKVLAGKAVWYANNQERLQEYDRQRRPCKREQERLRNLTDPQYTMRKRLSARLYAALRSQKVEKRNRTLELVGCNLQELRLYLEQLFQPGMTWENRRLWHVDHKRPVASFDLTDPEQQKIAFHFSNLQPLWRRDNQKKGAKINWVSDEDATTV